MSPHGKKEPKTQCARGERGQEKKKKKEEDTIDRTIEEEAEKEFTIVEGEDLCVGDLGPDQPNPRRRRPRRRANVRSRHGGAD